VSAPTPSLYYNVLHLHCPNFFALRSKAYIGAFFTSISGTIPTQIGLLENLRKLPLLFLLLYHRGATNELILETLTLGQSLFSGTLPSELGKLSKLGKHRLNWSPMMPTRSNQFGNCEYVNTNLCRCAMCRDSKS
jgi:hypothetical protein